MNTSYSGKRDRGSDVGKAGKPKACTNNDGYRVAIKRAKGIPKSQNKDLYYSKSCVDGCQSTGLARSIAQFERKHRRMATVDDVVDLFRELNSRDEPHANILLSRKEISVERNYYSKLEVDTWEYDDVPLVLSDVHYFVYTKKHKVTKIIHNYTFDEILEEHRLLLNLEEHIKFQSGYQEVPVQSRTRVNLVPPEPKEESPHAHVYYDQQHDYDTLSDCGEGNHFNYTSQFQKVMTEIQPILLQLKHILPDCDKYLDVIEDLIFISYVIMYCDDPTILMGILVTIYKKHTKGSLSKSIYNFISSICNDKLKEEQPQSADFRVFANKLLRFHNTVLFGKIKDGLALCIALGFINPINITVKNIRLFSCSASTLSENCTDFVTYVIDLVIYFFETGYQIFNGDYVRLFDMNELAKVDEDLVHLQTYISCIQMGSYKETTGFSPEEYFTRLMNTVDTLKVLSSTIKDKVYKSLVLNKLTIAHKLLVLFDQSKPLAGLREAPFSLSFFGNSSVGKSSSAKMVLTSILSFNDRACSDDCICVIQPTDKYYSTYKANVTGVIVDDLCNTRSEKAVVDPASLLISLINNIPYYAPKAEAKEKGLIPVRPAVVVTTTNVRNYEAHIWSNEPISVVRRLKYHITVKVKPKFMTNNGLDSSKITDVELKQLATTGLQDLWFFDVNFIERYTVNNVEKWRFKVVNFKGKDLVDLDIYELVRFLNEESQRHFEQQRKFVDGCKNAGLRHVNCKKCFYPKAKCICPPADDSVQGGVFSIIDDFCASLGKKMADYLIYSWNRAIPNTIERTLYAPLVKLAIIKYMQSSYLNVLNYIPYTIRETELYKQLHYYLRRHRLYQTLFIGIIPVTGICIYNTDFKRPESVAQWSLIGAIACSTFYRWNYSIIMEELKSTPLNSIVPFIQSHQAITTIFKVGLSVGSALLALKIFKSMYITLRGTPDTTNMSETGKVVDTLDNELHGNLNPSSYDDVLNRDKEVNVWSKTTEKFVSNLNTNTMTTAQLVNAISPNILHLVMANDEWTGTCIGCVALKSGIFCCPLHFFKNDKNIYGSWRESNVQPKSSETRTLYKLKFIKHDGESGNSFTAIIDYNDIVPIDGLDLCIFRVDSGGSFPDILKYCVFNEGEANTYTLRRDRSGTLHHGNARAKHTKASYIIPGYNLLRKTFDIVGGRAVYNNPTSCGDCMMVHVRDTKQPSIIGFHISGTAGTTWGSYTMFTSEQIKAALDKLEKKHGIFTPHSGSYFDISRLGTTITIDSDIPDKAPVNYIKDHNYIIRGTIDTQVSYFTEIKRTFMCSAVERIFGMDNIWAGPKFGPQRWKPWYTFLSSSSANDNHMDTSILKLAVSDYINPLKDALLKYNAGESMRPLTHSEIINGIPGKRFIDHINFKSAIGYPLKGKKFKYMKGLPTQYDFDSSIFELEYDKMREKYLRRERYYPIFKASLKDEPVKKDKDKVRVFQAADITLQYGWRKYGLPILRFLSMHPLLSECAVGINPYNAEWDQVHQHLTFNETNSDRIVAGDYKSWDQKLPATLVLAAFNVIISLARIIPGYSAEDVMIIEGLATDTTYYLSHFNGTLIEFCNGLPSGHNLTAHINSISNSLLLRYGYYYYKNPAPFRTYCHAVTYGDDFECGVSTRISKFDHLLYKKIVESMGMTLTMPDKVSDPKPFLHIMDCDFLKRRSIKCYLDDKYYGALDYNSMVRSLMVRGKTTISDKDHAYSVIRGFIHDLSFHNKMTYDDGIIKIRALLSEINLIMPEAWKSYEEYYYYRNSDSSYDFDYEEDVLDNATLPVGYPVTPEASGSSEPISYYVSSSEQSSMNECDMERGESLTEQSFTDSYLSTKVLGEGVPRSEHDDCIQSQVFGADEGGVNSGIVTTGTAILTSSADHTVQSLPITSRDMLSLRQDVSRDLQYYLSRPIEIVRYNPLTDTTPATMAPLYDFLTRSLIRDKVRYYAYLNAVLHIKVTVVGSPTMAGAQLIALHPWHKRDNGLGSLNFNRALPNITQASQLPSIITDLAREKGGELSMPIICPANGLDITDLDQIRDAFSLHYLPLTTARKPDTSNIVPQVLVYAWLTEVSLTGTTLTAELPQSDEYTVNNANKPSSDHISFKEAISHGAGKVVGKATEVGLNAAMSAMGFSNPNSQDGVIPQVPRLVNNMSCYNAPVNIDALAGDYKNEVMLDSTVLGYEDAEHMSLNNILSRWSLIGITNFTTGNTAGPTEAFTIPVTPMGCLTETEGNTTVYTPTALGVAALPFTRWRGTITYRLQAVGTAFMKGKIKISHDVKTPTTITPANRTNTQILNTVIWDLSTTTVIDIEVPWASNQVFKNCGFLRPGFNLVVSDFNPSDGDANGSLIINQYSVLNDNDESAIAVLISVKGEPGMAFGDMRPVLANYTFAGIDNTFTGTPQSGEYDDLDYSKIDFVNSNEYILVFRDGTYRLINPIAWVKILNNYRLYCDNELDGDFPQSLVYDQTLNKGVMTGDQPGSILHVNINGLENNVDDNDISAMVCMGEKWYSVRQIIKRYTHNWTRYIGAPSTTSDTYYRIRLPDRPIIKGWQGTFSLNVQPSNVPVTYARDSFLSFYSVCFLGYRGSLRHKVVSYSNHTATSTCQQHFITVARSQGGYIEERVAVGAVSAGTSTSVISASASAIPAMVDLRSGATIGHGLVNPVVEYSTPFYSRGKFCWAQDRYPQIQKNVPDGGHDIPWHQIAIHQHIGNNVNNYRTRVDKYVAAGDDFSLFFYLYGPRMVLNQPTSWGQ